MNSKMKMSNALHCRYSMHTVHCKISSMLFWTDSVCGQNPLNTETLMIKVEQPPTDSKTANKAALDERGRGILQHQK